MFPKQFKSPNRNRSSFGSIIVDCHNLFVMFSSYEVTRVKEVQMFRHTI